MSSEAELKNSETFGLDSDKYHLYRPSYPEELSSALARLASAQNKALDIGAGNGQFSIQLLKYFEDVLAADLQLNQISLADDSLLRCVCKAEELCFKDDSFDLITVAQAVHWFNLEKFYPQVKRLLSPGGIFAVFGYSFFSIDQSIDTVIKPFLELIDPYWSEGNRLLMNGYRELPFPFEEVHFEPMEIRVSLTVPELLGYLGTWSAVKRYEKAKGSESLSILARNLDSLWPSQTRNDVSMDIHLRAGRL